MARLPGPVDARRFIHQLRGPWRASAVRALVDGAFVVLILRARGARPLFSTRRPMPAVADPARSIEVAAAVDAALGLLPVYPSCLRRSVTLVRELQRLGLDATIHIGVRNVADTFSAHAWVQTGDVVVNDDPEVVGGYVEIASGELETLFPLLR